MLFIELETAIFYKTYHGLETGEEEVEDYRIWGLEQAPLVDIMGSSICGKGFQNSFQNLK